jgi:hypothetical protein
MSTDIKRLPADWSKDLGIDVLDPDGWRCDGTPWGLAITEQDFRRRAAMSTMREVPTPAPLDPSKVKAGDTVAVEVENSNTGVPTYTVSGEVHDDDQGRPWVGPILLNSKYPGGPVSVTITDHQPAPKPEWEPGTSGTAALNGVPNARVMRAGVGGVMTWWVAQDGCKYSDEELTDFVPDEPRPLPTRDEVGPAIHEAMARNGYPFYGDAKAILDATDAVVALWGGESR